MLLPCIEKTDDDRLSNAAPHDRGETPTLSSRAPTRVGPLNTAVNLRVQYANTTCDRPVSFCCNTTTRTAIRCTFDRLTGVPTDVPAKTPPRGLKPKLLHCITARNKVVNRRLAVAQNRYKQEGDRSVRKTTEMYSRRRNFHDPTATGRARKRTCRNCRKIYV